MTDKEAREILDAACEIVTAKENFNKKYPDTQIWMPDIQFGHDDVIEEIANALQLTRSYTKTSIGFLVRFTYNGVKFFGGAEK